ncbi:MAG TPA: BlaI/MecI/CopY family transcriptional regulator [Saprospiraceae bacterium]|nr:BlaI/MecI/CopY family transcriptional regulator [Saprospiraceae bacterium]
MEKLTKAEEEIMRIIWELEPCTVGDIRAYIEEQQGSPKPPHSTISTLVANISKKGYLSHKAYGRTYVYSAQVDKEDYSKGRLQKLVNNFFEGSMNSLVSFMLEEEELSKEELSDLLQRLDKADKKRK